MSCLFHWLQDILQRLIIVIILCSFRYKQVGSSYGKLSGHDRSKYEKLNCNKVASGSNPSCDDVSFNYDTVQLLVRF
jgi:hypothetical protein